MRGSSPAERAGVRPLSSLSHRERAGVRVFPDPASTELVLFLLSHRERAGVRGLSKCVRTSNQPNSNYPPHGLFAPEACSTASSSDFSHARRSVRNRRRALQMKVGPRSIPRLSRIGSACFSHFASHFFTLFELALGPLVLSEVSPSTPAHSPGSERQFVHLRLFQASL